MRTLVMMGAILLAANIAMGRPPQGLPPGMARYHVVLLKAGPNWTATRSDAVDKLIGEHIAYFRTLVISGDLVAVGPTAGGDVKGILIFRDATEDVKGKVMADPAVKAGRFVPEIIAWLGTADIGAGYAERAKEKALLEMPMETLPFALLVRGPGWTPEKTPETQKLQEGHMANINSMANKGKLAVAGPFVDGGMTRGLFIFRCPADEAKTLAADDPLVKADRLQLVFYSWSTNVDVIPQAPKP